MSTERAVGEENSWFIGKTSVIHRHWAITTGKS
jgi:hypothetical protein